MKDAQRHGLRAELLELERRDVEVIGMAQNAAAAKNLEVEAGIRSSTIHRHLREIGPEVVRAKRGQTHWWNQILQPRQIWVVDEASQLPNALTWRLLWHAEAVNFQRAARRNFSPSMRRLIDVDDVWRGGCRAAGRFLKDAGARDPATDPCPFTLDDLLARDFDVDAAAGRIAK